MLIRLKCIESPRRRNALASLVACILLLIGTVNGEDRYWVGNDGLWSDAGSWSPIGVPFLADAAHIGTIGGDANWTVDLDQEILVSELYLSNGRDLDTQGFRATVNDVSVSGLSSRLRIRRGLQPEDMAVSRLFLNDHGDALLFDGAFLQVSDALFVSANSGLQGEGHVRFHKEGGRALILDGRLQANFGDLVLDQLGTGLLDLDGDGSSWIRAFTGDITFNGTELHDPFGGTMDIHRGSTVNMNLAAGWEIDGALTFYGGPEIATQRLTGAPVTLSGQVGTQGLHAAGRIQSPAHLTATVAANIDASTSLRFESATTIAGGNYVIQEEAYLRFYGGTTIQGGTFSSSDESIYGGGVVFDGLTTWAGDVSFQGNMAHLGDAVVQSETTIQGDVFTMNPFESTTWQINAPLHVYTKTIGELNNALFGTMTIDAASSGRLDIQLSIPDSVWTMDGTMHLGGGALPVDRVSGSPFELSGVLHVSQKVAISADTIFDFTSETNLPAASSELIMRGISRMKWGAEFQGAGALINDTSGVMGLDNGAYVNVDVHNDGELQFLSNGHATVQRYSQSESGSITLEVGDLISNRLDVLQQVQLAGELNIESGLGYEGPQSAGEVDAFTLLTSTFILGEFDAVSYDEVPLEWDFVDANGYRSHDEGGLFYILDYASTELNWFNYQALEGDANGDGVVDTSDFNIWNINKFTSGTDWTTGDFNGDGVTDVSDFGIWNANKFTSVDFSASVVPEPVGWQLLLFGCLAIPRRKKRWI